MVLEEHPHEVPRRLIPRPNLVPKLRPGGRKCRLHLLPELQNLQLDARDACREFAQFLHLLLEKRHSLFRDADDATIVA